MVSKKKKIIKAKFQSFQDTFLNLQGNIEVLPYSYRLPSKVYDLAIEIKFIVSFNEFRPVPIK